MSQAPTGSKDPIPVRVGLVFEGGGAKGVAYIGALQALEASGVQVVGVAGASAGAITATLVAAGFDAEQLRSEIGQGMGHLGSQLPRKLDTDEWSPLHSLGRLKAFARLSSELRATSGAFDTGEIERWLEKLLAKAVQGKEDAHPPVTFDALHKATEIDLYVVAADVSRHEQVVFNHRITPNCEVVEAVLASSGIPLAFPAGHLRREGPRGARTHTIVDGGVWSNFPHFVFTDESFRQYYELDPWPHPVIGFILRETDLSISDRSFPPPLEFRADPPSDPEAKFLSADVGPARWEAELESEVVLPRQGIVRSTAILSFALIAIVGILLAIFGPAFLDRLQSIGIFAGLLAASFVAFIVAELLLPSPPERGTGQDHGWPRTRATRLLELALEYFANPWLATVSLILLALFAALGFLNIGDLLPIDNAGPLLVRGLFFVVFFFLGFLFSFTVVGLVVVVLAHRGLRDWGWGLARTYAAGPGAPPWRGVAVNDYVVKVSIPEEITTLSFDLLPDDPDVVKVIDCAESETETQLNTILDRLRRSYRVE